MQTKEKKSFAKQTLMVLALAITFLSALVLSACGGGNKELTLSAKNGATSVAVGNTLELQTTSDDKNFDMTKVEYQILTGSDYATLSGNILTPKSTAKTGNVVKIQSTYEELESNVLEISIIGIAVTNMSISANKNIVPAGGYVNLTCDFLPNNATDIDFEWQITEGSAFASVNAQNQLTVNSNATLGATVKVKAVCGNVESNELTFSVSEPQQIAIQTANTLTLDKGSASALPTLTANVIDFSDVTNPQPYQGADVEWTIVDGANLIDITPNGYTCSFTVKGHGQATVKASLSNGANATTTISVINPPEQIAMPEMLQDRTAGNNAIAYQVGNTSPINFVATATGSNVCEDMEYSFQKYDTTQEKWVSETSNGEFASYNDNQITFNTTGRVKVVVKSLSGSALNVQGEQEFNVNEGVNISTFDDLKTYMESSNPQNRVINLVVTEKVGDYGYSLVPSIILNNNVTNTTLLTDKKTCIYAQGNWTINGNNHAIDMSKLPILSTIAPGEKMLPALSFIGSVTNSNIDYAVTLNDLIMIGNCPVDAELTWDGKHPTAVHERAIKIGGNDINSACKVTMNNVDISKFYVGARIIHAVDSYAKNLKMTNCMSNGIEAVASKMTFENLFFNACGAVGIETTPDSSHKAGYAFNEAQNIELKGTIVANENNGNTIYFQKQNFNGATIPQIIQLILTGYIDTTDQSTSLNTIGYPATCAKFEGSDMLIEYVALIFQDPYSTDVQYSQVSGFNAPSKTMTQILTEASQADGDANAKISYATSEIFKNYNEKTLNLLTLRTEMETIKADSNLATFHIVLPQLCQYAMVASKFIDLDLNIPGLGNFGKVILNNLLFDFGTRENGQLTEIDTEALNAHLTEFAQILSGLLA